tara:strand:+ start:4497 stop:4655 length:159 start_codon:yes stop_codon:yes gene_type:complete
MVGNINSQEMLELLKKMLKAEEIAKGGKALEKEMEKMGYGRDIIKALNLGKK